MFQMIQERKNAVSDLPNGRDTSLTEEDSYIGEWFSKTNLQSEISVCLQLIQRVVSKLASC